METEFIKQTEKTFQKRQTAHKVRIKDILDSIYVKEEGWNPNYVTINSINVSRVNVLGTIVFKDEENSLLADDGSGKISIRSFEPFNFDAIEIGDFALIIGKPREFNNEKFIVPEIIKRIDDQRWIKVRELELRLFNKNKPRMPASVNNANKKEEVAVEEIGFEEKSPLDVIFSFIRKNDSENGVDIQEIVNNIKIENSEKIIQRLIVEGDLFEVKNGRVKILE